ncbi:MAG: potassium channel family protein [Planctomycetota bacterium]|nr:potassium channel family protein [Planctomycetota bacterium]
MVIVFVVGVVGYSTLADLDTLDAIYQTVITITTTGYTDLAAEDHVKPFTIALLTVGFVVIALFVSMLTATVIEAAILSAIGRRRLERSIEKLSDHMIVAATAGSEKASPRHSSARVTRSLSWRWTTRRPTAPRKRAFWWSTPTPRRKTA